MTPLKLRMIEDLQVRNLSTNTQTSYLEQVSRFARHFGKSPEELGPEDIRSYQVYLTNEKRLAPGSVLIAVCALRFLYKSHSIKIGSSKTSFRRPRSPRHYLSFSVRRKRSTFSGVWNTSSIARS